MDLHIIPECYIDTKLIKIAVPPQTSYNHQKGCSNVVKTMQEKFKDTFALGIIDKDKRIELYINQFHLVYNVNNVLELHKHPTRHHYIIFICPAVEKWIIYNADEIGLSLTNFNLPHNFDQLRSFTKTSKSDSEDPNSINFTNLFKEIKRNESPYWMILTFWIKYLKSELYAADIEYIKSETDSIKTLI